MPLDLCWSIQSVGLLLSAICQVLCGWAFFLFLFSCVAFYTVYNWKLFYLRFRKEIISEWLCITFDSSCKWMMKEENVLRFISLTLWMCERGFIFVALQSILFRERNSEYCNSCFQKVAELSAIKWSHWECFYSTCNMFVSDHTCLLSLCFRLGFTWSCLCNPIFLSYLVYLRYNLKKTLWLYKKYI